MNVFAKILVGALPLLLVGPAYAQNVHGILRVVKGDVQIKSALSGQTGRARLGGQVFPKDVIITGKEGRAKIVMVDNNEINVSPESQIEIQHYEYDPSKDKKNVLLNVIYGKVRAKVEQKYDGKTSSFSVKTPSAVAGVRGTDFLTSYDRSTHSTQVVTFRGAVAFGLPGPNGSIANPVSVTPGKVATSAGGVAPAAPAPMAKEQFAKMESETKAEAQSAPPAKSERTPATDSKKSGSSGSNSGSGSTASPSAGGPTSPAGPNTGGAPLPTTGASMINPAEDLAGGATANMPAPPAPPPPPVVAPVIKPPSVPNVSDFKKQNTNLQIKVK